MMIAKQKFYDGSDTPPKKPVQLRAGPYAMAFQNGEIRSVCLGEAEVLRRVYAAVRDRDWGTVEPVFSDVQIQKDENAFRIQFKAENRQREILFIWEGSIIGREDGSITFQMRGKALSTFLKNRIGFCVLVPACYAGCPVTIEHTEGGKEQAVFPEDICAEQPVKPFGEMQGIVYGWNTEIGSSLAFQGEVFEMEDQRLWTDASYKIFCTPLHLPYPTEIKAGTTIEQSVIFKPHASHPITMDMRTKQNAAPLCLKLSPEPDWKALLPVGLGCASHDLALTRREMERLGLLHLAHLRVDLHLSDSTYPAHLERAAREASALGTGLETAVFVSESQPENELSELRRLINRLQPPVLSWLIYPAQERYLGGSPTAQALSAARKHLDSYRPFIPFAAGTNTDLIFLKRTPQPISRMERVCLAINPQVHAFDNASLVETLEVQPVVIASARQFAGDLPVTVSPITLKPRFNAYATAAVAQAAPQVLPPQVDPRQMSLLGAGWTAGSLRAMTAGGAASVTYYETTGWRGVMETERGSALPEVFTSVAGGVYPLYFVFAFVGQFAGGQASLLTSSHSGQVSGLALKKNEARGLLVANHSPEEQTITIQGINGSASVRRLDETNVEAAMRSPEDYLSATGESLQAEQSNLIVHLLPFGLAFIDLL